MITSAIELDDETYDFVTTWIDTIKSILDNILGFIPSQEEALVRRIHMQCNLILQQVSRQRVTWVSVLNYSSTQAGARVIGRPRININFDFVDLLKEAGFTFQEIAHALQVSRIVDMCLYI